MPELLLSFTLISKSKKALETSLDLMSSFKASVDEMIEGLVSSVNYLESWCWKFIQIKYARSRRLPRIYVSFSGLQFFFLYGLFRPLMKVVKNE